MAGVTVEAGSALAQEIQSAAQAKLMETGYAAEENDTTLAEYVTMMLVNGKGFHAVQSELGGELLGVGEDDPQVADFTRWLFDEAQRLSGGQGAATQQQGQSMESAPVTSIEHSQDDGMQAIPSIQDEQMGDAMSADGVPSGPKAMRNGSDAGPGRGRGRGGRMLGQMNRQMDRTPDDPLRRIKGAASGAGRIDAHTGRPPRGPRGQNAANGIQRMMNGGGAGRGGAMAAGGMPNPMMGNNGAPQDQQMMFMQMMEMQANFMANMMQNGQMPDTGRGGFQGRGRGRGRGGKSMFDRINKNGQNGAHESKDGEDGGMELDNPLDRPLEAERKPAFETMCKFNLRCTNPECIFAHQSPANTRPNISLDMSDTCTYGAACTNNKCLGKHPSPAQRTQHHQSAKSEVICKFYPNCTAGPMCPFKHPDARPCRNGADCRVENCPFAHSSIACRYNPCTRRDCPFKHAEGQKRGVFADKVWTADGSDGSGGALLEANGNGKTDRFAELKAGEGQEEELILPGQQQQNGDQSMEAQQGEVS